MTIPRSSLVSVSDTPYYHCISRCVRRAFLCGKDSYSGQSFEHRRDWIVERLQLLGDVFAIDVCSYAVMSNHVHLVVCIDVERPAEWSIDEVINRWCRLFKGPEIIQRYRAGDILSEAGLVDVNALAESWRQRLADLSWFMRCMNEHIARRANAEDDCTGHFWEGRFKCQALLDDAALLTAMAYVDLNPIRGGMARTLAGSDKTSIQQRLDELISSNARTHAAVPLARFSGSDQDNTGISIPFRLGDYVDLVEWTGRCVRGDKGGAITSEGQTLLRQLGIATLEWLPTVGTLQTRFERVMGSPRRMRRHAVKRGGKFYRGYRYAERYYRRVNLT